MEKKKNPGPGPIKSRSKVQLKSSAGCVSCPNRRLILPCEQKQLVSVAHAHHMYWIGSFILLHMVKYNGSRLQCIYGRYGRYYSTMRLGLSFSLVHTSGHILCIQFDSIKHIQFGKIIEYFENNINA